MAPSSSASALEDAIQSASIDRLRKTLQTIIDDSTDARFIAMSELLVPLELVHHAGKQDRAGLKVNPYVEEMAVFDAAFKYAPTAPVEYAQRGLTYDEIAYQEERDAVRREEMEELEECSPTKQQDDDFVTIKGESEYTKRHEMCTSCEQEYDVSHDHKRVCTPKPGKCIWPSISCLFTTVFGPANLKASVAAATTPRVLP